MFLLLSNFALGLLPLSGKATRALENIPVLDHCLTAGCRVFYAETHLLPLPLPLQDLVF